jgi:hypothetical protein
MGPLPQVPPSPSSPSLSPSSTLPGTPSRANLTLSSSSLSVDSFGKKFTQTPTSPLGKSNFTSDDIAPPAQTLPPSPPKMNFLSRKFSIRPGTAPASPGPAVADASQVQAKPSVSMPSSPPSASQTLEFGRIGKQPARPGTAPTGAVPPTSYSATNSPATPSGTAPLFLRRIPSKSSGLSASGTSPSPIQRGKELPFPAKPMLQVPQRPSSLTAEPAQPASAGAVLQRTSSRNAESGKGETLRVDWQPRSASALEMQRPFVSTSRTQNVAGQQQDEEFDDRSSWVDFDDSPSPSETGHNFNHPRDSRFSERSGNPNRESIASFESQPDIDSVLETLNGPDDERSDYQRDSRYSYDAQSAYPANDDDADDDDDPRDRETAYYTSVSAFASDVEDMPAEDAPRDRARLAAVPAGSRSRIRYSRSPSPSPSEFEEEFDDIDNRKSRVSIMDGKRSGNVREKLVRRVERMRREGEQSVLR